MRSLIKLIKMMISFKCQVHPPQQPSSPLKVNKLAYICSLPMQILYNRYLEIPQLLPK